MFAKVFIFHSKLFFYVQYIFCIQIDKFKVRKEIFLGFFGIVACKLSNRTYNTLESIMDSVADGKI